MRLYVVLSIAVLVSGCTKLDASPKPDSEAPHIPPTDGCNKDTDCKGERVCANRTCVAAASANTATTREPAAVPTAVTQSGHARPLTTAELAQMAQGADTFPCAPGLRCRNGQVCCADRLTIPPACINGTQCPSKVGPILGVKCDEKTGEPCAAGTKCCRLFGNRGDSIAGANANCNKPSDCEDGTR
jgi:hypothetical protein